MSKDKQHAPTSPAKTPERATVEAAQRGDLHTPAGAVIPVPQVNGSPAVASDGVHSLGKWSGMTAADFFLSSIDPKDDGGVLMTQVMHGEFTRLKMCNNQVLEIQHVTIADLEYESDEGELGVGRAIVMTTTDGRCFRTWSRPVLASLATIMRIRGNPPWTPPIRVRVVEKPGRGTHTMLSLVLVVEAKTDGR